MKGAINLVMLLLLSTVVFSQAIIKKIRSEELEFPIIELPNKEAAQKINEYLQSNLLEQTNLNNPGKNLFNKVKYVQSQGGIDELNFKIALNNRKILSAEFFGEGIGAYPQPFSDYFLFNIQNGEVIFIEDIISVAGLAFLKKDIKRKRNVIVEKNLLDLKNDKETKDGVPDIKAELTSCNEDAELSNFSVTKRGITFHKRFCLPHVIQALEPDFDIAYSIAQLQDKLTTFGKKIFSNASSDLSNEYNPSIRKTLNGKIGNYHIVMQLKNEYENSISGFYYYTTQGICIELSGTLKGSRIELTETNKSYDEIAKISGTISESSIKGTWTNIKTKHTLPFEVSYLKK